MCCAVLSDGDAFYDPVMTQSLEILVGAGFEALARAEWSAAQASFIEAGDVPEALMGLANACYWLGHLDEMLEALEGAYRAAQASGMSMLAAAAAMSLAGYQKQFVGNTAAARGWADRAARIVQAGAPELRGELLGTRSFVTADPVESERLAREAWDIGRATGNPDLQLLAMTAVGAALVQQGRVVEGMRLLDEAMAAALGGECGNPLTAAHAACMTMIVCASHFDIERATQWVQAMERFIARYGCPFLDAECRTHYGRILFENGDWATAEAELGQAIAMTTGGTPSALATARATLAELRIAQGRREDAERLLRGIERRDETVFVVALLHVERGQVAAAAALARRRLDDLSDVTRLDTAPLVELLGRCAAAAGDYESAERHASALIALGEGNDCPAVLAYGQRLRGNARVGSDPSAAVAQFEAAIASFASAELPYRAAQTRLALAHLVAGLTPEVSAAEARAALTVFEDLGASAADDAAALLRQLGVRATRSGPKNIGLLTKREQEVLGLLGERLSNPEIAKRLYLSRKTVEHHVARILTKLGVRSRADAAAVAARNR